MFCFGIFTTVKLRTGFEQGCHVDLGSPHAQFAQ